MVASSIASDAHSEQSDTHTHASSTLGTTASLSSRIASLAFESLVRSDADGLSSVGGTSEGVPASFLSEEDCEEAIAEGDEEGEEEEEEEEVVELTEEQLINLLDREEDPFQVCSRLFHALSPGGASDRPMKHISPEQAQHFKALGFLVVDGFVDGGIASRLRTVGLDMSARGELCPAAELDAGAGFSDRGARSDRLCFLHRGHHPEPIESVLEVGPASLPLVGGARLFVAAVLASLGAADWKRAQGATEASTQRRYTRCKGSLCCRTLPLPVEGSAIAGNPVGVPLGTAPRSIDADAKPWNGTPSVAPPAIPLAPALCAVHSLR
uniref:Uncharacterized protein n=1 Tax=Tetraselmis sp. GSL018 TaxID=582737 RepID=A0A061QXN6_9CHLO|eukprot:CAMPEP_0177612400 /NCGR_PEP_ID=MMETSP0419_2-20121207/21191_1 /TAXON_ID=582737 /ORGANISM="Tetraselmis sp., Strain GSL018" /LENGTH=324 /DNA_ID=CAMNT_0019108567 /DNA_START=85 /DNA_END=1059 /DNA_ORIENTATION=+